MKKRQQLRDHMVEVIGAWEDSDMTQADFCRRRRISPSKFKYWRRKVQEAPSGPAFLELDVGEPSGPSSMTEISYADGTVVRLAANTPVTTIRSLIPQLQ